MDGYAIATEVYPRRTAERPATIYVHHTPGKTEWIDRVFKHPCVMLVVQGRGRVEGPEGVGEAQAPFGFLARPSGHYRYGPHGAWEEHGFVFRNTPAPTFLEGFPQGPWPIESYGLVRGQLALMGELCRHPAQAGVADQIDLLAQLLALLSWRGPAREDQPALERRLCEVEGWLRENFRTLPTLEGVPERFGLSGPTFRRHWRRRFAQSPWQYVLDLRLQEARRLLQDRRGWRIAEVADATGFPDQRHFATLYRRKFGETPTAARG